jgi:hypothetical protein
MEQVSAHARYMRVYFAQLPPPDPYEHWACLREFKLTGSGAPGGSSGAGASGGVGGG